MAQKVEIELDTLRVWFRMLDMNETEEVTELIYDKIQELEKKVKDEEYGRLKERETILSQVEPSLTMKQVVIDGLYRFKKQNNFTPQYKPLSGAEVKIISKGRTKVSVLIIEPGNPFTGKQIKTNLTDITHK